MIYHGNHDYDSSLSGLDTCDISCSPGGLHYGAGPHPTEWWKQAWNIPMEDNSVFMLHYCSDIILIWPKQPAEAEAPAPDLDNPDCLTRGTAFEWCGQRPVKDSAHCYSLTVTHQRAWGLVRPMGAGKFYSGVELMDEADDTDNTNNMNDKEDYSLNLEIWGKVTKVRHD